MLASPKLDEREIALELLANCRRAGGETLLGDKGYAGRQFAHAVTDLDATIIRPRSKDEAGRAPHLVPIRQRIESIFWTFKDLLTLERHGARTIQDLESAYFNASSTSPPASSSTTSSDAGAAQWSTTSPNRVESTI